MDREFLERLSDVRNSIYEAKVDREQKQKVAESLALEFAATARQFILSSILPLLNYAKQILEEEEFECEIIPPSLSAASTSAVMRIKTLSDGNSYNWQLNCFEGNTGNTLEFSYKGKIISNDKFYSFDDSEERLKKSISECVEYILTKKILI